MRREPRFGAAAILAVAALASLITTKVAGAQYPYVPPPVPCVGRGEGAGIFAGIASIRAVELPERKLAVLQFTRITSSADESDLALSGLRDRLVTRLGQARPAALRQYVGPAELHAQTPKEHIIEVQTLGKQLHALHLLAGRYSQQNGQVQVFLEAFDVRSGKSLWQESRTAAVSQLIDLEPALASIVAEHELGELKASEQKALAERETTDGLAYEHYVRGMGALNDTTKLGVAAAELERATARAPKLGVAWSGLAAAYTRRALAASTDSSARDSLLVLAVDAAERAVALAPKAAYAWVARGTVLAGGQRLGLAREAFERALAIQPSSAEAHRQLGRVLMLQGRASAAQSHLLRAVALAPEDPLPLVDLAELELNERAYSQSCRALDLALSINPRLPFAYELRAIARLHRGQIRPAWVDAETGKRLGAELAGQAVSALVDVVARDTASARNRMRGLRVRGNSRAGMTAIDGGYVALGFLAIGDRRAALDVLERVRPRDGRLYLILQRPGFEPLVDDARFQRLREASRAWVMR